MKSKAVKFTDFFWEFQILLKNKYWNSFSFDQLNCMNCLLIFVVENKTNMCNW